MSTTKLEAFLARIYVDDGARSRFLTDPEGEAMKAGLMPEEIVALAKIDRIGLDLFSRSLKVKRERNGHSQ